MQIKTLLSKYLNSASTDNITEKIEKVLVKEKEVIQKPPAAVDKTKPPFSTQLVTKPESGNQESWE